MASRSKPQLTLVANERELPLVAAPPSQGEMPFALVAGEPVTELPRDLYIPPQALEVFLEAFEGPLDLLLYLIRRQNLNILDIPVAEITRQYMQYIELMQDLELELAGEIGANPDPQLRMIKQLLSRNACQTDLDAVQRLESEMLRECWKSPEHKEAVQAFLEKRPPRFR